MRRRTSRSRHAFTLIESVVVIVVVALVVPGLLMTVRSSSVTAIDQQRRVACAWLASSVLESIQADAASAHPTLGFASIDDTSYLTDASAGLYSRLEPISTPYAALGISYEVTVGDPTDLSGGVAAASDPGALREVSVTVTFTDTSGQARSAVFSTIVANL